MKLNKKGEIRPFAVIFIGVIIVVLFLKFQADGFSLSPGQAAEITLGKTTCNPDDQASCSNNADKIYCSQDKLICMSHDECIDNGETTFTDLEGVCFRGI